MNRQRILVVDDEPDICTLVKDILEDEGFEVGFAENARDARSQFNMQTPDLVLLDIWMPGEDGISLLKQWQERASVAVPIVIMSGHGTVETAVEATRLGAHSFIEKPLTTAKLLQSVHSALENRTAAATAGAVHKPVGHSAYARQLRERAMQLAESDEHVAIVGEPGVGKGALAEYIHSLGAYVDQPFTIVHGAALNETSLDAALAEAGGGTLLIRRVHELPVMHRRAIAKTLTGARLASGRVRLVTTSLREPDGLTWAKDFKRVVLKVKALREHAEDVPELVNACIDYWCQSRKLPYRRVSIAAQNRLLHHGWPGNLGELNGLVRNLLESGSGEIPLREVEEWLQSSQGGNVWVEQAFSRPMREAREMFEKLYLEHHLKQVEGNVSRLAEKIGMERTHLYRKLRSLGVHLKESGKRR